MLVILTDLVFLAGAKSSRFFQPRSLIPSAPDCTANYGFLCMAQSLGSPIAAVIFERCGSWIPLFETIIAMGIITGPLALFVLKGLRRRFLATAFVTNDRAARRLGRGWSRPLARSRWERARKLRRSPQQ